ncbi:MAG: rod shape-determining protein MreC [Myxococcota bacterium]|nr:rod shape-determining protein MreC [Myxococcota bacterium]
MFLSRGGTARDPNALDRGVITVSSWLQSGLGWGIDGVVDGWRGYVGLRAVRSENLVLRQEYARLLTEVHALEEERNENQRLRALLSYAQTAAGPKIAARVVGVNPVSTLLSVRIDRGTDHGVRRNMPVVTHEGVVGHVERVTATYADVVLLRDRNTILGVRVQRSRARANAVGAGKDLALRLDNALRTEDLQEGDVVLTSGTDGIYPPGLVVGTLARVQRSDFGMFQSGEIRPAVDTARLEEVLVLLDPVPDPATLTGGAP